MIRIDDKAMCTGCGACSQSCPTKCIVMLADPVDGFLYPRVNESDCIECGLCEKICPVLSPSESFISIPNSYACINKDERIRLKSSSGGLFTLLAEEILLARGVVFGARFDSSWSVIHDYTETISGLGPFRGSKYVQSYIGNCFQKTKEFLKQGREVLFTGTPCQIAGLNHFLLTNYENLITMDLACHSVPSPKVWRLYIEELKRTRYSDLSFKDIPVITGITFRSKSEGWREYGLEIQGKSNPDVDNSTIWKSGNHWKNSFMRGFLQGLYIRPSCTCCPSRNYVSKSDITVADFWGVEKYHPEIQSLNDNKGVSLALIQTEKGKKVFDKVAEKMYVLPISYNEVEAKHGLHRTLTSSMLSHENSPRFYSKLDHSKDLSKLIEKCLWQKEIEQKIIKKCKKNLEILLGSKLYEFGKRLINK